MARSAVSLTSFAGVVDIASDGTVVGAPRRWLRLEGATLLVGSLVSFSTTGQPWWLVPLTVFVPDLLMVGYFGGTRLGARVYNLAHSTSLPAAMVGDRLLAEPAPCCGSRPDLARAHRCGSPGRLRPQVRRPLPTYSPWPTRSER